MKKYNTLLNKKISFYFNDKFMLSYRIIKIRQTDAFIIGIEGGIIFNCDVEWDNKEISNINKIVEFPQSVFDDLINKGRAENPMMPNMYYTCNSLLN